MPNVNGASDNDDSTPYYGDWEYDVSDAEQRRMYGIPDIPVVPTFTVEDDDLYDILSEGIVWDESLHKYVYTDEAAKTDNESFSYEYDNGEDS